MLKVSRDDAYRLGCGVLVLWVKVSVPEGQMHTITVASRPGFTSVEEANEVQMPVWTRPA
jgi:hypothetical protein